MEKTFETEVLTRLTAIETKLDDYKGLKEKAEKAYTLSSDNKEEIKVIKDNNKWAFRTGVGAIITSIISSRVSLLFLIIKKWNGGVINERYRTNNKFRNWICFNRKELCN